MSAAVVKAIEKGDASVLGVGLSGMRERIRHLGGQFTVDASEAGTNLKVTVPLSGLAARSQAEKPVSHAATGE
jgi:signal transduction histidine kinase